MILMPDTLKSIALAGGGFDISSKNMMPNTLIEIASCAAHSGKRPNIVIRVESIMMPDTMTSIALVGEGCVMFKFPTP